LSPSRRFAVRMIASSPPSFPLRRPICEYILKGNISQIT
jgi:hypothetical protein